MGDNITKNDILNENKKNISVFILMLILMVLSISCIESVSAQSSVQVIAVSEGGEFSFIGNSCACDIDVIGFDYAYTDITNSWGVYSNVHYNYIGEGEIYVKVNEFSTGDEFYYYRWEQEIINGNGTYIKGLPGGRSVTVENSTNITGYIDYRVRDRKAVFLFDTRHSNADLTVIVHNGELIENASVILTNGARKVQWTDENGEAEFSPHTGKYAMIVEHENFTSMLVDDLFFESDKLYQIRVNMTDCLSSSGTPYCAPCGDDLIIFYKQKEPVMNDINPQAFVNYFAEQLTTCMARQNHNADGTLERMATQWGVYPDPALGVLLYECDFVKGKCDDTWCEWHITYTVKNYQAHPYDYTVTLIADNTTTELNTGSIGATFSTTGRETLTKTVVVNCNDGDPGCGGQMYLTVISERAE